MSKSSNPSAKTNITPPSNITSDSVGGSAGYGRPSAGGNVTGQDVNGKPVGAPPAVIPGPDAYRPNLAGNVPASVNISGAAIVAPVSQPDATGHPAQSAGSKGTAGDSGPGLGQ